MRPTVRSVPARWLLLCVLAFGVLSMHHVAAGHDGMAAPMTSMTASSAVHAPVSPDHDGAHSPFHVCLAVLLAAVALLLASVLLRRVADVVVATRRAGVRRAARPPPPRAGRALLAFSCVLRI